MEISILSSRSAQSQRENNEETIANDEMEGFKYPCGTWEKEIQSVNGRVGVTEEVGLEWTCEDEKGVHKWPTDHVSAKASGENCKGPSQHILNRVIS